MLFRFSFVGRVRRSQTFAPEPFPLRFQLSLYAPQGQGIALRRSLMPRPCCALKNSVALSLTPPKYEILPQKSHKFKGRKLKPLILCRFRSFSVIAGGVL